MGNSELMGVDPFTLGKQEESTEPRGLRGDENKNWSGIPKEVES